MTKLVPVGDTAPRDMVEERPDSITFTSGVTEPTAVFACCPVGFSTTELATTDNDP